MTRPHSLYAALLTALAAGALTACPPGNPTGGDAGADAAASTACRSDRECSAQGLVCDRGAGRCVECLSLVDCSGGRVCLRNACITVVPCTTSRMCPGQVCDNTRGYCVDCTSDVDCPDTQRCSEGACVARPRPCRSSRECSDMAQVCDMARGVCVDCASDLDCGADERCSPEARCVRASTPGPDGGPDPMMDSGTPPGEDASVPDCPAPTLRCGGACVDPRSDTSHCGGCGRACAAGQSCNAGVCAAPPADLCAAAAAARTNAGCEFWAVTTATSQLDPAFPFGLLLANGNSVGVDVTITGGALTAPAMFRVGPNSSLPVTLPWVTALAQHQPADGGVAPARSALVTNGAYRVVASAPLVAWQHNPLGVRRGSEFSYTNDASLLLPTHALGDRYAVTTRPAWQAANPNPLNPAPPPLGAFLVVVGTHPAGTEVTVSPTASVVAGTGIAAGSGTMRYTLGLGDVLQLVNNVPSADLTGSLLSASRPVAAFAGHDCAWVPATVPACDHLEEQLVPTSAWGRSFAVTQLRDRLDTQRHRVRVLAANAGTTLTFAGIPAPPECSAPLSAMGFCEFETAASFTVAASQPVAVTQFMLGGGDASTVCNTMPPPDRAECRGDPSMLTEVPVERFRSSYELAVSNDFTHNRVNIVTPLGVTALLDGAPVTPTSSVLLPGGYTALFVTITPGFHRIAASPATGRLGVKLYGSAPYASYGAPGGFAF